MKNFTVAQTTLTAEQISDVLCSALDPMVGGSNYWVSRYLKLDPTSWEFDSDPREDGRHYAHDYPLNPGGALLIVDGLSDDDGVLTLDAEAIQKGLAIMAEKYPRHFANILTENSDAETGDVLLQCCLLGDIIYG